MWLEASSPKANAGVEGPPTWSLGSWELGQDRADVKEVKVVNQFWLR